MANTLKQFEGLFNYATIGIVVTDTQGVISDFNKKANSDYDFPKT
jgi:hypothetical protein